MKQDPWVGRSEEIQKLMKILVQGWNSHGNVVFIAGTAGMGKTTLLDMMRQEARGIPELAQTTFAIGVCDQIVGPRNAFQPFVQTLEDLAKKDEQRKSVSNLLVTILKETAPDWLQMIPTFGPALAAGAKTATITTQWMLDRNDSKSMNQANSLAGQYTNTLVKMASNRSFLTLMIEDAHWIDDASCQLLFYLAQKISVQRLVVLVTYRPDYVDVGHPLHKVQAEMRGRGLAQLIELKGLAKEQIDIYVRSRFGNPLHPLLANWLENLCNGNPFFLTQYISLLEEKKIIRSEAGNYLLDGDISRSSEGWQAGGGLANTSVPQRVEEVLKQRIERLLEEERKLLQLGSVQGDYFMSAVLAQELAKDEFDVLDQLNQLVEKYAIISLYEGSPWLQKLSESYSFEHHLIQQAFYNKLSPRQRQLMHRKTAEILDSLWKQPKNRARGLTIEVAHHYSQGDKPLLAAQYYFLAAQSSFSTGAFVETIELCKKTLENLKQVDGQDRIQAEAIQLLLMASETRWRGKPELQGDLQLRELAQQAENAAARTADLALLAQTQYLRSLIVLATEGRARCIDILKEALHTAQQQGDQLNVFVITAELGHQLRGDNQAQGLAMLYEAS
jgi:predicted ATPase